MSLWARNVPTIGSSLAELGKSGWPLFCAMSGGGKNLAGGVGQPPPPVLKSWVKRKE